MEVETFVQHEAIRSEIYKLLAECYYPPEKILFDKIKPLDKKFKMVCLQDIEWSGKSILKADSIEDLTVEHARLFMGPYSLLAPPYGSIYMEPERRIMGNSTMDVIRRYQQSGLAMAEDFKDSPDHIAAELEFMHFLIYKELEASNEGDDTSVYTNLLSQQSFLTDHLGAWVSEFVGKVMENAKTTFYQNLARATETFIKDDYQNLTSLLNSWSSHPEKTAEIQSLCGQC